MKKYYRKKKTIVEQLIEQKNKYDKKLKDIEERLLKLKESTIS